MKNKILNRIIHYINNFFLLLGITLLFLSILTIIVTVFTTSNLALSLTSSGLNNFYNYFGGSIKLGGASLALLTIYVTIVRMRQTNIQLKKMQEQLDRSKEQIVVSMENNLFNNYYKHKEIFKDYFLKSKYVKFLEETKNVQVHIVLDNLYRFYFYKTYREFKPELSEESENLIAAYLNYLLKNQTFIKSVRVVEPNEITQDGIELLRQVIHLNHLNDLSNYIKNKLHPHDTMYNEFQIKLNQNHKVIWVVYLGFFNLFLIELYDFLGLNLDKWFFDIQDQIDSYLNSFRVLGGRNLYL